MPKRLGEELPSLPFFNVSPIGSDDREHEQYTIPSSETESCNAAFCTFTRRLDLGGVSRRRDDEDIEEGRDEEDVVMDCTTDPPSYFVSRFSRQVPRVLANSMEIMQKEREQDGSQDEGIYCESDSTSSPKEGSLVDGDYVPTSLPESESIKSGIESDTEGNIVSDADAGVEEPEPEKSVPLVTFEVLGDETRDVVDGMDIDALKSASFGKEEDLDWSSVNWFQVDAPVVSELSKMGGKKGGEGECVQVCATKRGRDGVGPSNLSSSDLKKRKRKQKREQRVGSTTKPFTYEEENDDEYFQ